MLTEYFLADMPLIQALLILIALILVGVIFDVVGVAFASCDQAPFIAMSSKKNKKAHYALKLLKNADVVSNFCNDVIGDVCGIVSGAAGAAITLKALVYFESVDTLVISIVVSSLIGAFTVAGKAIGKSFALKNSKKIVLAIGSMVHFFSFKKRDN